jgi:hypothetical protein
MATITLKINEQSKLGKAILDLLISTSKESKVIEILEDKDPYDPAFVKMIKKSAASKKRYKVDTDDIWGSLGLK